MRPSSPINQYPTPEEMDNWLDKMFESIENDPLLNFDDSDDKETSNTDIDDIPDARSKEKVSAFDKLMALEGLEEVKEAVQREISYHRIMQIRRKAKCRVPKRLTHLLLVGNPGTGKTTVAKLIGKIYHEAGILENDTFIETNRAALVGEYIGHSEARTKELIEKARGGILFIDEIYSLAEAVNNGCSNDFGRQVIDTLMPLLSDPDSGVMVIGAGYPDEMKKFLKLNSGLASRFPVVLRFNDFSIGQLMNIASKELARYDFRFSEEAEIKFRNLIKEASALNNSGNARLVVSMISNYLIPRLCMRIDSPDVSLLDIDSISVIEVSDVPDFNEIHSLLEEKKCRRNLGFCR